MKNHIPHGVIKNAFAVADKLEPLKSKKDPKIAAVAAFLLGGFGLGVYLDSLVDFFVPWLIVLVLIILGFPFGELPLFVTPLCWAYWGYRRVKASNAKLDAVGSAEQIIDAEVITDSTQALAPREASDWRLQAHLQRLDDLRNSGILTPSEHAVRRDAILQQH